jgi:hypothetical protein
MNILENLMVVDRCLFSMLRDLKQIQKEISALRTCLRELEANVCERKRPNEDVARRSSFSEEE